MIFEESYSGEIKGQVNKSLKYIDDALVYLQLNNDFDTFNRLYFIREIADPAYGSLTLLQNYY
jgi:cytochrome c peroxidase